jgi:anti-sigma regulatory factor (Ser/Thr protein kinase)
LTPGLENVLKSEAQDVADRLVKLIEHHHALGAEARSGLLIMFAELVENIHRHAGESTTAAFACAQVYPKRRKLTVCIVDTGMGLAQSIASGSNRELASRLQHGESALALAKAPLLTSKPDRHSGYGLYVATELILRNGGTFRMISGNESLTLYRKNWRRRESFAPVDRGWKGTWITMIIDLESVLPIKDVYLTLPSLEDSEKEDFFG